MPLRGQRVLVYRSYKDLFICKTGAALVYWLLEETHNQKVVSLNLGTGYWMNIFTLICCKNCNVGLKKTNNKRKKGQEWPVFTNRPIVTIALTISLFILLL